MATFTYDQTVYQRARTEIRLGIYPSSDASAAIELYRAVQGSTATFTLVTTLYPTAGQSVAQYDDFIPDDNLTRYYKARSLRGTVPSTAYTATVSAKPAPYLLNTVMTPALSGIGLPAGAFLSTQGLRYGRAGATRTVRKMQRYPAAAAFQPELDNQRGDATVLIGTLRCTSSAARAWVASAALPPGATLRTWRVGYSYSKAVPSTFRISLYSITTAAVATLLKQFLAPSSGLHVSIATSSLSATIGGGNLLVEWVARRAALKENALDFFEVGYDVGQVEHSL